MNNTASRITSGLAVVFVLVGTIAAGQARQNQQPAPAAGAARGGAAQAAPAAPPPGSPATYKSDADIATALKNAAAQADPGGSGQTSAPFANTDQYRINIVHRAKAAGALAHAGNTELHHIIEGSATVVTGGKIVRGAGGAGATIEGGVSRHVTKGDVILVPADTPHWYKYVDGSVTYLEVRFVVPVR